MRPLWRRRVPTPVLVVAAALSTTLVTACGTRPTSAPPPAFAPDQRAGTVVVAGTVAAEPTVQRLRDAITGAGGAVATTWDVAASAQVGGVALPPTSIVVGGAPAAVGPLLAARQTSGVELPQRYLVRQDPTTGQVSVVYRGAPYVSAVHGITDPAAGQLLAQSSAAVVATAAGTSTPQPAAPLVGVTPGGYLRTVFGSADVPSTAQRLARAAPGRAPTDARVLATVDLAAGVTPAVRPTTVVLVDAPALTAPLLQAVPSVAQDLPLSFVIWLDDQNRTQIGYVDPRVLARRHGIDPADPAVAGLATAAERLVRQAAGVAQ